MKIAERLFTEALQNENNGLYEKAEEGYRDALQQIQRKKMQSSKLKDKISMKIKLMNTVIEYNSNSNINK